MKSLLEKVMEQISMGMAVIVQGLLNYKKDMEKILFQLHKQYIKMDRIDCHIPCILELYGMPRADNEDLFAILHLPLMIRKMRFPMHNFFFM